MSDVRLVTQVGMVPHGEKGTAMSEQLQALVRRVEGLNDYQRYRRTYNILLILLAWEAGELSEEYVAELLEVDRVSARELKLQMIEEAKAMFLPRKSEAVER